MVYAGLAPHQTLVRVRVEGTHSLTTARDEATRWEKHTGFYHSFPPPPPPRSKGVSSGYYRLLVVATQVRKMCFINPVLLRFSYSNPHLQKTRKSDNKICLLNTGAVFQASYFEMMKPVTTPGCFKSVLTVIISSQHFLP